MLSIFDADDADDGERRVADGCGTDLLDEAEEQAVSPLRDPSPVPMVPGTPCSFAVRVRRSDGGGALRRVDAVQGRTVDMSPT